MDSVFINVNRPIGIFSNCSSSIEMITIVINDKCCLAAIIAGNVRYIYGHLKSTMKK